MKIRQHMNLLMISLIITLFSACATAPKGLIPSTANPKEEIEKLSSDLNSAQENHVDILARKYYLKSVIFLQKSKNDLTRGKSQDVVLEHLRFGRDYLNQANTKAEKQMNTAPALFEARENAIIAGASRSSMLINEWTDLDEDIAGESDNFDSMSSKDMEEYQLRYVELEKKAVIESKLGRVKAQINGAKSDGASKRAPITLRKAEMSLNTAESLIGRNVTNPSAFEQSVQQAEGDSQFLSEVTTTLNQNEKTMSESAAIKLVSQKRQISGLTKNLKASEQTVAVAESVIDERNESLEKKDRALEKAQTSVYMQKVLEKSRQQFLPNEAVAYQQGNNLLIRLKSMNFVSGRSELPDKSIVLLAKVLEVAKMLDAREIMIEGHTDSVGTTEINKKLSEQRANTVATYFKSNGFGETRVLSEGHGFDNPIATNKSKMGRAQNRRVDIIITPM